MPLDRRARALAVPAVALLAAACASPRPALVPAPAPEAPLVDTADDYHGTKVPDPYRWLEDPDSPESRRWIEAQNARTFEFLGRIPERPAIRGRLTELWNFVRWGEHRRRGPRTFYFRNDGLQNQAVLFVEDAPGAAPRLLLDPNALSPDGTTSVAEWEPSDDGSLLAYSVSTGGSDWREWRVRRVDTGEDLPDVLRWSKFSGASWAADGSGFYYSRYDEPVTTGTSALRGVNYYQKLCFHRLGEPQGADRVVYERPDEKEWGFGGGVTDDGRWLVIHVWKGSEPRNRLYLLDLADPAAKVLPLVDDFDAAYEVLGNDARTFYLLTTLDAPRQRIVAVDLDRPGKEHWRTLVPESPEAMQVALMVGDRFVCEYLRDARSEVRIHALDGRLERVLDLPGLGSAGAFSAERRDPDFTFHWQSFAVPPSVMRCDPATGALSVVRAPRVPMAPDDFVTTQVFATSRDGTRVPVFLSHRRGLRPDGERPVLLYAYGGFGISVTPAFSPQTVCWMERGGVYAVANLRGGGEYGEAWHRAALRENRPRAFEDFEAAAEHLVATGWTKPARLAISGGSNGGLLVGACMTRRPDLYGAALPAVGVLDMLRYHRFTIGWAWIPEYGNADEAADFPFLHAYSPLHNLKPGTAYPATLITTADHDDRVVPAHSFKFAAALQAAHAGPAPALIRIEVKAGHGAGKPTSKRIDEAADTLAFLTEVLR